MDTTLTKNSEAAPFQIDAQTTMGKVTLGVSDLETMADFYTKLIGLTVLDRSASAVELGVNSTAMVRLERQSNGRQHPNSVGLFHLAILLPSRAELGQWLQHLAGNQYSLTGASDHLASEALYLDDPEGNGIEIYRDRPREAWVYENGELKLATLRLDLQALLGDAKAGAFERLSDGTIMGHVHLRVDDVERTAEFYRTVIGFDVMTMWPEAGFLSAGGYHHHLGMNIWRSKGQSRPPEGSLGLLNYEIKLPEQKPQAALLTRLEKLEIPVSQINGSPSVTDPSGNQAVLVYS